MAAKKSAPADRKDVVVSVRFAPEELQRLRVVADRESVPLSAVVRRAATATSVWTPITTISTMSTSGTSLTGLYTGWAGAITEIDQTAGVVYNQREVRPRS